jgi:DNA-binding NtrC family response regulator
MNARILVVEDEKAIRLALCGLLRRAGYEVELAENGERAVERLADDGFDLVLTDLALGEGCTGMEVLASAKELRPEAGVVMITAHGTEKIAVQAIKNGADDYVPKPFDNDELRVVVARVLEKTRLAREHRMLLERVEREYGLDGMIGSGPRMREVFEAIQKVAETDLTVLVRGESGTGKELVAQALHHRGARSSRPFVAVNCAAISRELVESELFGHEKGAFTGADARRTGRFEAASGGTIFLDEVGDMPLETQAKVLRVLQERKLERVGGTRSVPVDVRVVAATHRDLEREVREGRFREDLYFRLAVVSIDVPPLRERREDVPALAGRFLEQIAQRAAHASGALSPEAVARLVAHDWPGNVRELRNVVEQAAVLANGPEIAAADLGLDPEAGDGSEALLPRFDPGEVPFSDAKRRVVSAFERAYLLGALRRNGGNVSRTARTIGMVRQSLQQKIREHDLRSEDWARAS